MTEAEFRGKAEACVKALGHELFGRELGGAEPNTKIEDILVKDIRNYSLADYGEYITNDNPNMVAKLKNLQSCMSVYPEILVPEGGLVYRGLKLGLRDVVTLWHKNHRKPIFKFQYKAKTFIESWSEDIETGNAFGETDIDDSFIYLSDLMGRYEDNPNEKMMDEIMSLLRCRYGFTIATNSNSSEFLFKAKYLDALSVMSHKESEVLRIGNHPINCEWRIENPLIFEKIIPFMIKYKIKTCK